MSAEENLWYCWSMITFYTPASALVEADECRFEGFRPKPQRRQQTWRGTVTDNLWEMELSWEDVTGSDDVSVWTSGCGMNQNQGRWTYILRMNKLMGGVVTDSKHEFTVSIQQATIGRRRSFTNQVHTSQILHNTQPAIHAKQITQSTWTFEAGFILVHLNNKTPPLIWNSLL